MNKKRKIIVYIAASLDGFIAAPGEDLSFLSVVEKQGEDYGYNAFIKTIDTVIMGRKTYDWVMKQVTDFPHAAKETYIITRSDRQPAGKTIFYNGSLAALAETLKEKDGKNIFVDGGAEVVHALLKDQLIDEMIVSVIPILLGDGTRLFNNDIPQQKLHLVDAKTFETGLVQLHYAVKQS